MSEDIIIREALDTDSGEIAALIGAVFAEYPGCIMDLEGECPDLLRPASHYRAKGGRFWVAAGGGEILATIACEAGAAPHIVALERLYVKASARKRGLARTLCLMVETFAREAGATVIDCWSDTRFLDAHRLYEQLGYERGRETRELHDLSNSREFHFVKRLGPA